MRCKADVRTDTRMNCKNAAGDMAAMNERDILLIHLQDYSGSISFVTDAWMSPNHYVYVALTAHLENQGQPIAIVLDIMEVAKVSELLWCS